MRCSSRSVTSLTLAVGVLALGAPARTPAASGGCADEAVRSPSGVVLSVPVVKAHRYRMDGRIRPLLFWIGRSGVGSGEIVWRSDGAGARAWELLIGSDPETAPRRLNRWGYIVEAVQRGQAKIVGLMSTSEEASISDVEQDLASSSAHSRFKTIEATVVEGHSRTVTGTIDAGRDVTLRDAASLVDAARQRLAAVEPRVSAVPAGVRPGFLTSVSELVDLTIDASAGGLTRIGALEGTRITYVYGVKTFDLVLTSVSSRRRPVADSPGEVPVLRSAFEIRPHAGRDRYKFELEYPVTGDLAGVPTQIRYQPRWWLQLDLRLEEEAGAPRS